MNTVDEAIQILHAIKNGKAVQYHNDTGWVERIGKTVPAFTLYKYRVKPEPREIYVSYDKTGGTPQILPIRTETGTGVSYTYSVPSHMTPPVRFREVVE